VSDAAAEGSSAGHASAESPVRAVFFGSGGFAVPILDALVAMPGIRVEAVVSAPDRPVGRKAILTPTPVTARARELELPVLQPVRVRRTEAVEELRALAPDLIVLADYGQLIPRSLLDVPPRGFLNLHPSALPRWRGAAPIPATILAGDRESAVTLIVVTEEMDAGPIVASAPLEVKPDDTAVTLEQRASLVAGELLRRALPEWLAGRLVARPQPAEGVTMTRPLRREDGRLDAACGAAELERQIRAYQPWPGAYIESAKTIGGRLIVKKAHAAPSQPGDDRFVGGLGPGSGPFSTNAEPLFFPTSDGRLVVDVMQAAGGREMSADEYLRGHPDLVDTPSDPDQRAGS
jgi:methionyl-tRNA formyltransferase